MSQIRLLTASTLGELVSGHFAPEGRSLWAKTQEEKVLGASISSEGIQGHVFASVNKSRVARCYQREKKQGDFPGGPVVKTSPSNAKRVWVRSLVGELRSHMPHGQKNQNIKQKQYCNKFNKDFKNCLHKKKS